MSVPDRVAEPLSRPTPVLYEVRDSGVAVLTLNRPERMNGWGGGLATTFYSRLDDAEADPDVRAIVVTGNGRAFCAGADMGDLTSISSATVDAAEDTDVSKLVGARHPHFVTTLRKPVIAAINGACAGIGLTHGVDVRRAVRRRGREVHHVVRASRADRRVRHLAGSCRASSAGAPRWTCCCPVGSSWPTRPQSSVSSRKSCAPEDLLPRAIAYAEDIAANCAPSSLAVIKQQVYADTMRDVFEASDDAEKLMHESMQRPDFIEGITSFFEKRQPNFPPLSDSGKDSES